METNTTPNTPDTQQAEQAGAFLQSMRERLEQETGISFERLLALRHQANEEAAEHAGTLSARELGYLTALHDRSRAIWDDPSHC